MSAGRGGVRYDRGWAIARKYSWACVCMHVEHVYVRMCVLNVYMCVPHDVIIIGNRQSALNTLNTVLERAMCFYYHCMYSTTYVHICIHTM